MHRCDRREFWRFYCVFWSASRKSLSCFGWFLKCPGVRGCSGTWGRKRNTRQRWGSCLWGAQGHCGAADAAEGWSWLSGLAFCTLLVLCVPPWEHCVGRAVWGTAQLSIAPAANQKPAPFQHWEGREIPLNVPSASNALGQGSIASKADCAPSQEAAPQCPHPNSILGLLLSGCLEICGQSVLLHLLLIWQDVKYSAAWGQNKRGLGFLLAC